jgi:hypothetical protein
MANTLDTTFSKRISEYVVDRGQVKGKDVCIKRVTVKHGSTISVDPLGIPVIVDGSGYWKIFRATDDVTAVTGTGGIGDAKIGVIVGSSEGYGRNQELVSIGTGGTEVHVLFGVAGNAIVKSANFDWTAGGAVTTATNNEKAAFVKQLEIQGVRDQAVATTLSPTYVP